MRASHVVAGTAHTFELQTHPLESPWWWASQAPAGARAFVAGLRRTMDHVAGDRIVTSSLLCKALVQRDLVQIYGLLLRAHENADDPATEAVATELQASLAQQIRRSLLSEEEYRDLVTLRPKTVPKGFAAVPTLSLADDYLPVRVITVDSSWTEIPQTGQAFRHFLDYGGRSSIKVYMRATHLDSNQIGALWRDLYGAHGADLHVTGTQRAVPLGFETMLVRSFGVLVSDGTFRDSTWPEEVIIRAFKHPESRVDMATSDFRGTLFYQYRMVRSDLLRDPESMGLRRVHDDDEQFFGFFGDVPDPGNSYSDTTTTMRANCISCHSEMFYGLSTIFSFERDPENHSVAREFLPRRGGGYDVDMPMFKSLRMWLDRTRNGSGGELNSYTGDARTKEGLTNGD